MSTDAKACGYLELDITGFQEAIETAKKAFAGLAGLFVADKIKDFFVDGTKDAINFGNEMYNAGQKLGGFDPGNLLLVDKALEAAGLSASEANEKVDEFLSTNRNISEIFGGAEQYAEVMQEAARTYGSQAQILSANAESFAKVFHTIEDVSGKMKTFFLAASSEFVEPLQTCLNVLNEIDLAGIGKSFGSAITAAVETLAGLFIEGNFLSVLQEAFVNGIKIAIEYAVGGVKYVSALITQKLGKALSLVPWGGIGKSVLSGLFSIGTWLITLMQKAAAALSAGLVWAIQGMLNCLPAKLRKFLTGSEEKSERSLGEILQGTTKTAEAVFAPLHAHSQAAENFFGNATKDATPKFERAHLFNLKDSSKDLEGAINAAREAGKKWLQENSGKGMHTYHPEALKAQQAYRTIGDSLAKVGGGGGVARMGLSVMERETIRGNRIAEENKKINAAIEKNTSKSDSTTLE